MSNTEYVRLTLNKDQSHNPMESAHIWLTIQSRAKVVRPARLFFAIFLAILVRRAYGPKKSVSVLMAPRSLYYNPTRQVSGYPLAVMSLKPALGASNRGFEEPLGHCKIEEIIA